MYPMNFSLPITNNIQFDLYANNLYFPPLEEEKPKEKTRQRKEINKMFFNLREQMKLEKCPRKTHIDSFLKKFKSKLFKSIHESVKNCLTIKLKRIPQKYITDIKIDFNKFILEQTVLYIYKESNIFSSFESLKKMNCIKKEKENILQSFLGLKIKEVYFYYLNSKIYNFDYWKIFKKEGENIAILFDFIAKAFIEYYLKNKGNKTKKKKKEEIKPPMFIVKKFN